MGIIKVIAALLFSGAALAGDGLNADADAVASADGTVLNHNTQMNTMLDNDISYSTFNRESVTCPESRLSIALMPNHAKHMHSDSTSITGILSLDMPLDINGTISRCKKHQNTLLSLARLDNDMKILTACIKAMQLNIHISKEHFQWAEKCKSVNKSLFLK